MEDWTLIVATLYVRGSCNKLLPAVARRRVWAHGDGYGKMSIVELSGAHLLEDWSHIRDSSPEGVRQIAQAIRTELMEMSRRQGARFPALGLRDNHYEKTVAQVVAKLGDTTEQPVPCDDCGSLDRYGSTCDCD